MKCPFCRNDTLDLYREKSQNTHLFCKQCFFYFPLTEVFNFENKEEYIKRSTKDFILPNNSKIKLKKMAPNGKLFFVEEIEDTYDRNNNLIHMLAVMFTGNVEEALPFVAVGTSQRCPYCTSSNCLRNKNLLRSCDGLFAFPSEFSFPFKRPRRYVVMAYQCKKWGFYFVVQRISPRHATILSKFNNSCPRCNHTMPKHIEKSNFIYGNVNFVYHYYDFSSFSDLIFLPSVCFFECEHCGQQFKVVDEKRLLNINFK